MQRRPHAIELGLNLGARILLRSVASTSPTAAMIVPRYQWRSQCAVFVKVEVGGDGPRVKN